jgi:hypothetical protein
MASRHVFAKPDSEVSSGLMEATPMIMSENYFRDRADDCNRLAREESDFEMRGMLSDLELDYRAKALHAAAQGWRDAPRYFELAEA